MTLYELLRRALASLDFARPIYCGFTANLDIVVSVAGDDFLAYQKAIGRTPVLGPQPPSPDLASPADMVDYVAWFMANGRGGEADIPSLEPVREFIDMFPKIRSVGGTGAQAANSLAYAGFKNVFLALPVLTPDFDDILSPDIRMIPNNQAYADLMAESSAFSEIHCIVDYAAGTRVATSLGVSATPRHDRVILSGDRCNSRLRVASAFKEAVCTSPVRPALLITGYNAPRNLGYFYDFMADSEDLIHAYRRAHPGHGFIHVEDCYQWDHPAERRRAISERIWPLVDSVGMNEVEYELLSEFFGLDPVDVTGSLLTLADRHGLQRVNLHTAGRCHSLTRFPIEDELVAIGMAIVFSAARAYYGGFVGMEGLASLLEATKDISACLEVGAAVEAGKGYRVLEVPTLKGMPVKSSIGLGDAFTAGIMACM